MWSPQYAILVGCTTIKTKKQKKHKKKYYHCIGPNIRTNQKIQSLLYGEFNYSIPCFTKLMLPCS